MKTTNPKPLPSVSENPEMPQPSPAYSRVEFGNFHATYTNEPFEYRQKQFKMVRDFYVLVTVALAIVLVVLAIFAPPWTFWGTSGAVGVGLLKLVKGRSP